MNKAMLLKQYLSYHKKSSARLPSAYQEVEYIESTGNQWIDTNIKVSDLSSDISMSYKFMPTNTLSTNESAYLGTYGTYPNYFMQLTTRSNISNVDVFIGNPEQGGEVHFTRGNWTNYEQTLQINITGSSGSAILNSNTQSFNYTAPTISGALYLFALNNNGTPKINSAMRLYEFKFKNNGTLIRNLIPCYRKSDNEIGLYDIVNNQFYTNQGTGTFLCGRPLVNIDGYEQLDYIESSGKQYIDTGIYQNSSARKYIIETSFNTIDTPSYIIRGDYDYIAEAFQIDDKGNYYIGYCGSEKGVAGAVANEKNSFECYFSNGSQYVKKNGTTIISMSKAYSSSYSYKITIFKGTIVGTWAKAKLYYLSIYSNGTLVREFIPMRRKLDNELGLYDLVNKVFYTNQGSGSFIAGEVLKA